MIIGVVGLTYKSKSTVDFDRNFDRKNTKFWPKLAILTEILTENHRSEKRWSKFFFDRSVKIFWLNFWPKFSVKIYFDRYFDRNYRSKYYFDRHFDRLFRSKYKILTEIWTKNSVKILFWPKFSVKILYFDRNFRSKFYILTENLVKIRSKFWCSNLKQKLLTKLLLQLL